MRFFCSGDWLQVSAICRNHPEEHHHCFREGKPWLKPGNSSTPVTQSFPSQRDTQFGIEPRTHALTRSRSHNISANRTPNHPNKASREYYSMPCMGGTNCARIEAGVRLFPKMECVFARYSTGRMRIKYKRWLSSISLTASVVADGFGFNNNTYHESIREGQWPARIYQSCLTMVLGWRTCQNTVYP